MRREQREARARRRRVRKTSWFGEAFMTTDVLKKGEVYNLTAPALLGWFNPKMPPRTPEEQHRYDENRAATRAQAGHLTPMQVESVFSNSFMCMPYTLSDAVQQMVYLWARYYMNCETFDRLTCVARDDRGDAVPTSSVEQSAVARNASEQMEILMRESGMTRKADRDHGKGIAQNMSFDGWLRTVRHYEGTEMEFKVKP